MATEIRLWSIEAASDLRTIPSKGLALEESLEERLENDISILSEELLVIGRQIATAYGSYIDLLCMDGNGDTVIVELKRDRTPRQVTAQALDYGSWVQNLSNDEITELANAYLKSKGLESLEDAFQAKFEVELPDVLNDSHSMLIVGSQIDSASERIISYLSDNYGVDINAATFQYFRNENGQEFLARTFLVEPSQVEDRARRSSKRKPGLTYEQLLQIAEDNNVAEYYSQITSALEQYFFKRRTRTTLTFAGRFGKSRNALLNLIPGESDQDVGLRFQVFIYRFAEFFSLDPEDALKIFPQPLEDWAYHSNAPETYQGYAGFFSNDQEVQHFINGLQKLAASGNLS